MTTTRTLSNAIGDMVVRYGTSSMKYVEALYIKPSDARRYGRARDRQLAAIQRLTAALAALGGVR